MSRSTKNTERVAAVELARELAGCRADARRYRFLCEFGCLSDSVEHLFSVNAEKAAIDAVIDEEIAICNWCMENPE